MYKEAQAAPPPSRLEALFLNAAVAHVNIRLLDLSLPPSPFHGVVEIFVFMKIF
jgi:hypothetical protein